MRVLHATAEYQGLAKTGGLADMVAALSIALVANAADVRVCVPAYAGTRKQLIRPVVIATFNLRGHRVTVIEGRLAPQAPLIWLIECPALYERGSDPYRDATGNEFADNALRFGIFSEAIARLAQGAANWTPDIVHLHDWHCALAAAWLALQPSRPRIVFTIHNLAHQGLYSRAAFTQLGLPEAWWHLESLEFYGDFSFMKAGLVYSDAITTVSPTYAREIQTPEYGCKLDGLLRARAHVLHGIVNGIDDTLWNPETDTLIPARYNRQTVAAGKAQNKQAIQTQLGLPPSSLPLVIFIGRLADQKGADLILAVRKEIQSLPLQFVMLASGEAALEKSCQAWATEAPDRVAVQLKVDEALAHRLTAAADLQIMPSRFEPCGLNQMYAQRYGAIPIVRNTGGLADTVVDAQAETLRNHTATGVKIEHADVGGVLYGLRRGLELIADERIKTALQQQCMTRDFSWRNSAVKYLDLYASL